MENDTTQINFTKYYLQKFGQIIRQSGKQFVARGDLIGESAEVISAPTDTKIFIEHHRSQNLFVAKEKFLHFDDQQNATNSTTSNNL